MGLRALPFFKAKKGWMFAGGGLSADGGGGGGSLPIATSETLGAVRVGNGLNVANDGTLSTETNYQLFTGTLTNNTITGVVPNIVSIDGYYGVISFTDYNNRARIVDIGYYGDSTDHILQSVITGTFTIEPKLYGNARDLTYRLYLINPVFSE